MSDEELRRQIKDAFYVVYKRWDIACGWVLKMYLDGKDANGRRIDPRFGI